MSAGPVAGPEYAAHVRAIRLSFPELVAVLRGTLGPRLCAYLGSVKETRAVNEWADGAREPSEAVRCRLRLAFQVAEAIATVEGAEVARAWFQGSNPRLGDRTPARALRDGDVDEVGPLIVGAGRAFLLGE